MQGNESAPGFVYLSEGTAGEMAERYVEEAGIPVETRSSEILVESAHEPRGGGRNLLLFYPSDSELEVSVEELCSDPDVSRIVDSGDFTTYSHRMGADTYDVAILEKSKVDVDIDTVREILGGENYSSSDTAEAY